MSEEKVLTSTQLAEYVDSKDVTMGAQNTPGREINYKRLDGEEPGKALSVKYVKGKIPEESRQLLSKLKAGDKFVVVKQQDGKWWNLKEFRDASTWVEKPARKPWTGGGGGKPYSNNEDKPGATAGGVLHDAVALCVANKKTSVDEVLQTALTLIDVHRKLVEYCKSSRPGMVPEGTGRYEQEEQLANEQYNRDLDADDEIPF